MTISTDTAHLWGALSDSDFCWEQFRSNLPHNGSYTGLEKEYPDFVISFNMGSVTSLNATHLALNGSREMHFSEIRERNNNMHNHIGNVLCTCCAMTHSFQPHVTKVKVWQRAALCEMYKYNVCNNNSCLPTQRTTFQCWNKRKTIYQMAVTSVFTLSHKLVDCAKKKAVNCFN